MDQNKAKWLALISLYLVQGLPHGFFGQAMPVLLREQGVDLKHIGLMALVALPWALKFLWAPMLDRFTLFPRHWPDEFRRSWILAMNYSAAALLIAISFMPLDWIATDGLLLFGVLLIGINVLIATQDIATDATAVENLSPHERGFGNGVQVGGYRTGMVLAGGLLVSYFSYLGWQVSLWLLALMMVLGTLPLYAYKPKPHQVAQQSMLPLWKGFFNLKDAWLWVALISLYKVGDAFGTQMIRPYLSDAGLSLDELGTMLGGVGFVAGLAGALYGGWLVGRISRARALTLFLLLEALAMLGYVGISIEYKAHIWLAVMVEHITGGMATAALFTIMMDRCREHSAAADYALQSCVVIVTGMFASAISGYSAATLGYDMHFAVAALACVAAVWLVYRASRAGLLLPKSQTMH